jgi:hypothetical protein
LCNTAALDKQVLADAREGGLAVNTLADLLQSPDVATRAAIACLSAEMGTHEHGRALLAKLATVAQDSDPATTSYLWALAVLGVGHDAVSIAAWLRDHGDGESFVYGLQAVSAILKRQWRKQGGEAVKGFIGSPELRWLLSEAPLAFPHNQADIVAHLAWLAPRRVFESAVKWRRMASREILFIMARSPATNVRSFVVTLSTESGSPHVQEAREALILSPPVDAE